MKNFKRIIVSLIFSVTATNSAALGMVDKKIEEIGQNLFNATLNNNFELVQEITDSILKLYPPKQPNEEKSTLVLKILNTRGFFNQTPLIVATVLNNVAIVKTLVATAWISLNSHDFEEFINAKDKENLTALDIAKIKYNTWKDFTIEEVLYINNFLITAIKLNKNRGKWE